MDWNLPFSSQENVSCSKDSSCNLPFSSLEKEDQSCWLGENVSSFCNMVEEEANSVLSGEAMIGLKLGKHVCNTTSSSSNNKTSIIKRSRASNYLSSHQSPQCQVEGCNIDLSSAKDYHRRHRICANHSKSPKVVVGGMERRFCQQCSRFHDLSEFDDRKRSCRRRLSAHNARRRRPQSEEISFGSTRMSSSICDRRPRMNFLLNRGSVLDSAQLREHCCNYKGKESLIGFAKGGGIDVLPTNGTLNFCSAERLLMPRNTNLNGMVQSSNMISPGDVNNNAFSLLSTSSWSSSWPEDQLPSSFDDQFAHGNSMISLAQPGLPLELQNTTTSNYQDFRSYEFERFYSNC